MDNTVLGDELPNPTRMADLLGGVRRSDVLRVYTALVADDTVEKHDKTYVRVGLTGASRPWYPRFLAESLGSQTLDYDEENPVS